MENTKKWERHTKADVGKTLKLTSLRKDKKRFLENRKGSKSGCGKIIEQTTEIEEIRGKNKIQRQPKTRDAQRKLKKPEHQGKMSNNLKKKKRQQTEYNWTQKEYFKKRSHRNNF